MPTYICKDINSDINQGALFFKEMSENTGTTSSVGVSVVNNATDTAIFVLEHGKPNSNAWEGGVNITFELNITATNGGAAGTWRSRCRVQMRAPDGSVLENGTLTAFQGINTTGVKTYTIAIPVWAQQDCANRLSISVQFNNISGATRTATIGLGTTSSEVVSPITENAAACSRIFIA